MNPSFDLYEFLGESVFCHTYKVYAKIQILLSRRFHEWRWEKNRGVLFSFIRKYFYLSSLQGNNYVVSTKLDFISCQNHKVKLLDKLQIKWNVH